MSKGFRIQEAIFKQAPFRPGDLSQVMLWRANPTESLFYFSEKSASFQKGNGKKHAPLCLADFEVCPWISLLATSAEISERKCNMCEISQCICIFTPYQTLSVSQFFTSEPDRWKASKASWKAHCISSTLQYTREIPASDSCWTSFHCCLFFKLVMLLKTFTCLKRVL